ncbi:MAG TPA: hypothetical protein VFY45_06475 [Baekduia sp.]|nr:hypothetical protein [Baekduia sp.]
MPLGGSPLNVYVGERGQLQAFRAPNPDGIYYRSTSTTGDAGFFLAVPGGAGTVYGFSGTAGPRNTTDYTTVSAGAVTGTGTAADPLKQETIYRTGPAGLLVTQRTSYVNGSQFFTVEWAVKNTDMGPAHFKAFAAADFFFDGSDHGTGIYTDGPPRFIGGTNADTGNSGGFAEVPGTTPWSRYQALEFGGGPNQVWGKIEGAAASTDPTFDNTVVGEQVDNAGGVEWDHYATGPGLANRRPRPSGSSPAAPCRRRCRSTRRTQGPPRAYQSTSPSVPSTPTACPMPGGRCATRSPGSTWARAP